MILGDLEKKNESSSYECESRSRGYCKLKATYQFSTATGRLSVAQLGVDDTCASFIKGAKEQRIILERLIDEVFILVMDLQHVLDKLYVDLFNCKIEIIFAPLCDQSWNLHFRL